jgi:hypothetical protein
MLSKSKYRNIAWTYNHSDCRIQSKDSNQLQNRIVRAFHAASWNHMRPRKICGGALICWTRLQPPHLTLFFLLNLRHRWHRYLEDTRMTPSFGLTGGDLITVLDSVKDIGKAVHDLDGASAECQRLVQPLHALQLIFQCLESLDSDDLNQSHMSLVQAEADKFLRLLSELLQSDAKSATHLESTASTRTIPGESRRAQWPLAVTEKLSRLQSGINLKIEKMNLSAAKGVEQSM